MVPNSLLAFGPSFGCYKIEGCKALAVRKFGQVARFRQRAVAVDFSETLKFVCTFDSFCGAVDDSRLNPRNVPRRV